MRRQRRVLAALVAGGVVLGLASAWWVVRPRAAFDSAAGPWHVNVLAGSPEAGTLTRARVAIGGLLALNRTETMYFVATHDSAGQPLRSRCRYRIAGPPPDARWWSMTAYADDHFLFPDEAGRHAINGSTAKLDERGFFTAWTGPRLPAEAGVAWLPTPGDRGLVLTLRVYKPAPSLQAAPGSLRPPVIERQGACP